MSATFKPWTEEETQDAARQAAMGASYHDIGLSLNRTSAGVHCHLAKRWLLPSSKSGTRRPCLCCGKDFNSAGAHNRMCPDCRRKPDPGEAMRYA